MIRQVDSTLFNAIESIKLQQQQLQSDANSNFDQNEDFTNELLIVATSYLLPRLVGNNFYHVEYEALEQSAHCTAYAIKELMVIYNIILLISLVYSSFSMYSSSDTVKNDWITLFGNLSLSPHRIFCDWEWKRAIPLTLTKMRPF